jgi:uncharacterized membrane protein
MVRPVLPSAADRVAELDLLRGFAAVLMVFNHVGYAVLTPQAATQGVSGAFVFLGSMAPVLFFFATGFGGGLAARPGTWRSLADKVLLLVLADQFLSWRHGHPLGLDFFAFIAVSMIAARLVLATTRPVAVAAGGIVVVLLLRYGVGPLWAPPEGYGVLQWLIGAEPHDAVSYPAAPWLVYPLLGVALGVLYRRHAGRVTPGAWTGVASVIVVCAVGSVVLAVRGSSFHRWSSVAGAFFALSVAVLFGFVVASALLTRLAPRAAAALSLGGVASFAVVPLHYALARSSNFGAEHEAAFYLAVATLITLLSFGLSKAFEQAAMALPRWLQDRPLRTVCVVVIAVAAAASFAWARSGSPIPALAAATLGQLAIGLLFAWRAGLFGQGLASQHISAANSKP